MNIDLNIVPDDTTVIGLTDTMISISKKRQTSIGLIETNVVRKYEGAEHELATALAAMGMVKECAHIHDIPNLLDKILAAQRKQNIERAEHENFVQAGKDHPAAALAYIKDRTDKLIAEASALGVTVKIDTAPLKPLAMRNYKMVPDVYLKFVRDTD